MARIVADCPKLAQKEYKQVRHSQGYPFEAVRSGGFKRQKSGTSTGQKKFSNQMSARPCGVFTYR